MQDIRCEKCHKLLFKTDGIAVVADDDFVNDGGVIKVVSINADHKVTIEIQCPHNYRDENGKNVQCKTLNKIII